jgi:short-subunit dehydrogenase
MTGDGAVVVITGASGGIGAAIARQLGREGKRLVLAARREPELRSIATEAETLGSGGALAVPVDVTRRKEVDGLRDAAISAYGRIDVWINNAGRGITRPVLDLSDDDVDDMISVNLKSALYGMQAAMPHFIERESGHLINMSSFLGRVPVAAYRSAYSASKAALNSLTANLRMDLRTPYPNIHVSLVMPGTVTTDFARNAAINAGSATGGALPHPLAGPMQPQTPEEIAERIAELIRNPMAEIYTNPASAQLAREYYVDVGAFEEKLAKRNS